MWSPAPLHYKDLIISSMERQIPYRGMMPILAFCIARMGARGQCRIPSVIKKNSYLTIVLYSANQSLKNKHKTKRFSDN